LSDADCFAEAQATTHSSPPIPVLVLLPFFAFIPTLLVLIESLFFGIIFFNHLFFLLVVLICNPIRPAPCFSE